MDSTQVFHFLRSYLEMGLLLISGFAAFSFFVWTLFRLGIKPNYSHFVRIGYLLLISSVVLPLGLLALPRSTLFRPAAQVWSGGASYKSSEALWVAFSPDYVGQNASTQSSGVALSSKVLMSMIGITGSFAILLILLFTKKLFAFHQELRSLPMIRRIGRVVVLASDHHPVAFSTWTPRTAIVVVPSVNLSNYSDYHLTVRHELQHHRHGDTQWLYFIEFLKAMFFWNPAIYGFSKLLSRFQEFACDEFLIGRRKFSSQAYGSCLIRAAESTIGLQSRLVGTTGMAATHDPSLLKRRIEMILNAQSKRPNRAASIFGVTSLVIWMTSIAYATTSSLQDRKLSLDEAKKYEVTFTSSTMIPITVNDLVLDKLNYFIGTPEGRKWVKRGLERMPQYRQMILSGTKSYDLPEDLIAIPLLESGFKNLPPHPPQKGAGIWEFIAETATKYSLEVSNKKDDRLNPEKETEAAMQYLRDLYSQFKDWRLAIKAYNEGETQVQNLINQYGTRDPWILERKKSSEGYLSGAMAMIIILKNPELLN